MVSTLMMAAVAGRFLFGGRRVAVAGEMTEPWEIWRQDGDVNSAAPKAVGCNGIRCAFASN